MISGLMVLIFCMSTWWDWVASVSWERMRRPQRRTELFTSNTCVNRGTEEYVIKAGLTDYQDYAYCDKRTDKMKTYCIDLKSQLLCTGINSSCFAHSGWTDHEHCVTQLLLMVYVYSITLKITTVPWLYQNRSFCTYFSVTEQYRLDKYNI